MRERWYAAAVDAFLQHQRLRYYSVTPPVGIVGVSAILEIHVEPTSVQGLRAHAVENVKLT